MSYLIRMQPGVQTPDETLERGSGSCRDSSWLLVQIMRRMGLAARFVSGYLIQLKADVPALDGPSGPVQDFTDLHAWCEVYLPGAGWIGLDPTSGLFAGEGHLPLACTPEPAGAAPITGLVEECEVEFDHAMRVERIWEAPRVTKPYSEEQWVEIDRAGRVVDADLDELDVRLTMGGEPTFVSVDHPDAPEWNTGALGDEKRRLAGSLYRRLREHYAPHGLAHFGQGKWYPGEALPRWSLNCFWRRDGEPVWQEPRLLALHAAPGTQSGGPALAADLPQRLLAAVADALEVTADHAFPVYEDTFYYLWRERRLPGNVDPFDSRLEDPQERARLAAIFTRGLDATAGHVLPLARDPDATRWRSGPWFLRDERCYLLPGDSPIGYRLPLDSLPWVRASDYPYMHQPDPTQPLRPLPAAAQIRAQLPGFRNGDLGGGGWDADGRPRAAHTAEGSREGRDAGDDGRLTAASIAQTRRSRAPQMHESAAWIARTAMCAQVRDGCLYVFMPPAASLEDYLQLVAAVEAAAETLSQPVMLEGYEPPRDPRLVQFRITPDPGVIEVNVHPAAGWGELVERTTHLYEQAHQCRLSTEKFMLDGRHTGTGGGNHFVMGGATTLDSPFLRRPDLLRSLLAYWHNHPSLSYLFAGLFIGPTSQAPRVDEARNDSLYELELAFSQVPAIGRECPPWLTDRLFRNLLIDVTGNTHRTEFCIDKLYSPDGPNGRLGAAGAACL